MRADKVVGEAKIFLQNKQDSSLNLLIDFFQARNSKVAEAMPIPRDLKAYVKGVGIQVDVQDNKLVQLEKSIKKQNN